MQMLGRPNEERFSAAARLVGWPERFTSRVFWVWLRLRWSWGPEAYALRISKWGCLGESCSIGVGSEQRGYGKSFREALGDAKSRGFL